jgi:Phytanoyl-CoA dioxygenase (PhyH)
MIDISRRSPPPIHRTRRSARDTNTKTMNQPLTDHERYDFDRNGFVVRRNALTTNEVRALHSAINERNYPSPGESIPSQRFNGFLPFSPAFRALLDHDAVLAPMIELCGDTVRLDHCYGIHMQPGTAGLGLHGGGTPFDPSQYYTVRDGHMYNGLVAVQWALVDHGPGDGGFCCIPGSHRANFELPEPVDPAWVVDVALQAGDLLFFTEALTHGTTPWTGREIRRSLFFKYAPGHLAWGRDYALELYGDEVTRHLTDRQKLLFQSPSVWPHPPVQS